MILNIGNEVGKVKIEQKQYSLAQKNVAKSIQRLLGFMYKSEPIHAPPLEKKKPKQNMHDNVININVGQMHRKKSKEIKTKPKRSLSRGKSAGHKTQNQ